MDISNAFQQYWPFMALVLWFGYKWWNSQRVVALLPELKKSGATLIDVRSAAEFASAHAPGTLNILAGIGATTGRNTQSLPRCSLLCQRNAQRHGQNGTAQERLLKRLQHRNLAQVSGLIFATNSTTPQRQLVV